MKDAVVAVLIIAFVSQILIFLATAVSHLAGAATHFNYLEALGSQPPAGFVMSGIWAVKTSAVQLRGVHLCRGAL